MQNKILVEIEQYLTETGMSAYRLGILSVRNGRIVERLRAGGRVWPETEQAVRQWIKAQRAQQSINSTPERALQDDQKINKRCAE